MNKKGFTLFELLMFILLFGIILMLGLFSSRNMLSTSFSQLRKVSNSEVYDAAKEYVVNENISFNKVGYTCVFVNELIELGYLDDTNDEDVKGKIIKVVGNNDTKHISDIKYDIECGQIID